jgi:hypothetical protein
VCVCVCVCVQWLSFCRSFSASIPLGSATSGMENATVRIVYSILVPEQYLEVSCVCVCGGGGGMGVGWVSGWVSIDGGVCELAESTLNSQL